MSYLKPQNPIKLNNDYIYPLTTADQVITGSGERLNSLFKKTIKETATLQVANWSDTKPYTQTITLTESTDDYNVDVNVAYGDGDNAALNKAAGCISYIKKNHKEITFYCLKSKPEVDIPVEITGTCRNTIATVEEGIKLNFDIKSYSSEEEMLADTPMENTIGVVTDVPISSWHFVDVDPDGSWAQEGAVYIRFNGNVSAETGFNVLKENELFINPVSVLQKINGVYTGVTAMIYQSGEWKEWAIYVLNLIDSFTTVRDSGSGSVTIDNNTVTAITTGTASNNQGSVMYFGDKKIDLSEYNTLSFHLKITGKLYTELGFYSANTDAHTWNNKVATHQVYDTASTTYDSDINIDISSVSSQCYFAIGLHGYAGGPGTNTTVVSNIKLLK